MGEKVNVSIIIPTYKSTSTLKRAVDSVLNQTYKDLEVIVVDDNDPTTKFRKNTEQIMNEYINNIKVKYIKHECNKNGSAARNTGFKFSKGQYICLLDDDDIFLSSKIEKQLNYLEENKQFEAVYCWRYENREIVGSEAVGDLSKEILSLEFTPYTSSLMMRRECFEGLNGFDESYKRHQDFEFLLRFFEKYSIGVVQEPLMELCGNGVDNRVHGREYEKLKQQFLKQFAYYIDKFDKTEKGFEKTVYAKHYSAVFFDYLSKKQIKDAIRIFFKFSYICGLKFVKYSYIRGSDILKIRRKRKKISERSGRI